MKNDTIQQLERNIAEAKKIVELDNALERLLNNRDFKKVIQEGYFEQEAIRLVHLKADPNFQTAERQQALLAQMDSIGNLWQYFVTITQKAGIASNSIDSDEQTREELLAEED